jgi:hypothetical protein
MGPYNFAISGDRQPLLANPEATCESRESVETTRETS